MASYIAAADGNFNTGSTWKEVSANSLLDSEANNVVVATAASWTTSATFVPGAVEVDGVAVKLYARGGTTGTFTIELYNSTDGSTEGTCTVNCSDFCSGGSSANEGGWVLFTFAAHTLDAADNHVVRCQTSSASQITLYRDATAANISRMVRTTTAAASPPAAASILHIMEEKTEAGTATTRTVTMDAISSGITKYGSGTADSACLTISDGGTLNYGYTAATNYYLQLDGNLIVYNGGTLTLGTVANPIPRDGSAILEFDPGADGAMGLIVRNGSTFTAQGLSRTVGNNTYFTYLTTNTAHTDNHIHTTAATGWLDNDQIVIASTSATYSNVEYALLNGADPGTGIMNIDGTTHAGTIEFVHSGTSPTQAEVILLTRNVKIRSSSATVMSFVTLKPTATVDIDWAEFYYLGEEATDKYGFTMPSGTQTGVNIQYSSFHDMEDQGFTVEGSGVTASYNVFYNLNTSVITYSHGVWFGSGATSATFNNNIIMKCLGGLAYPAGITIPATSHTSFSDNIATSNPTSGFCFIGNPTTFTACDNNTSHSNGASGFLFSGASGTISNLTSWRNGAYGIVWGQYNATQAIINGLIFDGFTLFGNTTTNIGLGTNQAVVPWYYDLSFIDGYLNADSTFATTNGVQLLSASGQNIFIGIKFINCDFGSVSGIKAAHTNDILISNTTAFCDILLVNCKLASGAEVTNPSYMKGKSYIRSSKHDQTTGASLIHKTWVQYGTIETDLTYYNTAVPSMRLTPTSATAYTLESSSFKVNVNSGQVATPSVYVRKSTVASGGALYNGSQPRLVVKRNDAIGITADTVIETQHVEGETANWEQLTGNTVAVTDNGVAEFSIRCDGTAGFVNVDDFTATVA